MSEFGLICNKLNAINLNPDTTVSEYWGDAFWLRIESLSIFRDLFTAKISFPNKCIECNPSYLNGINLTIMQGYVYVALFTRNMLRL